MRTVPNELRADQRENDDVFGVFPPNALAEAEDKIRMLTLGA